jgi:hypothetical protein
MEDYRSTSNRNIIIVAMSCIILFILLVFYTDISSSSTWNKGVCPSCHERYELRGVSQGLKYYACPKCGKEVQRF